MPSSEHTKPEPRTGVSRGNKTRLDVRVVDLGFFPSRREAQSAIMSGAVLVNNEKITKPGTTVRTTDDVALRPGFEKKEYVGRGGLKLEKALDLFGIDVTNRICLDIGASTGGFTDCLLKHGARLVYAIDVGYGQLDWSLRNDARVVVRERTNARYLEANDLYDRGAEAASLAAIDCSFISVLKILPATIDLLTDGEASIVALLKPQFEAERGKTKKGVVRDRAVHLDVLESVLSACEEIGLFAQQTGHSPIKGPAGNIEFLLHLTRDAPANSPDLRETVDQAWSSL